MGSMIGYAATMHISKLLPREAARKKMKSQTQTQLLKPRYKINDTNY
jgi:hypothetical protein